MEPPIPLDPPLEGGDGIRKKAKGKREERRVAHPPVFSNTPGFDSSRNKPGIYV
jgi:hypothetical protein